MGLTDLQIKKLTPRDKRFEVSDGNGLSIRIAPGGAKTWVFRYSFQGVPRRMNLGSYPGAGLSMARERHAQAMQALQRGIDPGIEAQAAKQKLKAVPDMKNIIDELWDTELKAKRSGTETLRLLQKDVISHWSKRKVSEIKRRDIVLLLDGIVKRGSPITRNRVHSALTRLFNFAAERGVIDDSPCTRIKKITETSRNRVLSHEEIKLLWAGLNNKDIDVFLTTKMALKLILLTGQRSGEVCGMTWAELDEQSRVWTIPAERMKNSKEHVVPLTNMACAIIDHARQTFGDDDPFVFPSANRKGPITRHSLSRAVLRHWEEMGLETAFSPHDIRRTVRTQLADLKIDEFVAERVLGHLLQGMLAVYNQHPYLPEKRAALEQWEARLSALVDEGSQERAGDIMPLNVISITEARDAKNRT